MRPSALLREAMRNVSSGTTRFVTFGLVLLVMVCSLSYLDIAVVSQQIAAANKFRQSGAATLTLSAQKQIDGSACQRLSTIPGVRASGALRESTASITITALPDAPVPEFEVTPGFSDLLSATPSRGAGLMLSQQVVEPLNIVVGQSVSSARGNVLVAATYDYPSDGRRPGFGYAALSVTSDQAPFDECWVEAWPQIKNLRSLLFTTLIPGSENGSAAESRPSLAQLNSSLGESYAGNELFYSRITRYAAPLMFVLAAILGFLAIWVRRLQLASALHAGVSKRDLAYIALLESVAWSIPSAIIGAAVVVALVRSLSPGDEWPLLLAELGVSLAGFCGVSIGGLLAVATIREKFLFRFFKDR